MNELEIALLDRRHRGLRIEDGGRQGQLAASLLEHGQRAPVIVIAEGEPRRAVLIDGYRRVAALERLGRELVWAAELAASEVDALVMCHKLDGQRRRSALEEGWFLHELMEGHGLRGTELALRLERSRSWISRRLSLVKVLPTSVQEAVRRGRLRPQVAMKVLVPLARANAQECERLVERLGAEPWTVRQMERLYGAWRRAGPAERERICEHPELYRKVVEELTEPASSPTGQLLGDLGMLAAISRRAHGRLEEGAAGDDNRRRVLCAWQGTRAAFAALASEMEEQLAGSGHTHCDSSTGPSGPADSRHRPGAGPVAQRGQAGPA